VRACRRRIHKSDIQRWSTVRRETHTPFETRARSPANHRSGKKRVERGTGLATVALPKSECSTTRHGAAVSSRNVVIGVVLLRGPSRAPRGTRRR
jgi:hypothetical protein